jgi:hypothetical protein
MRSLETSFRSVCRRRSRTVVGGGDEDGSCGKGSAGAGGIAIPAD